MAQHPSPKIEVRSPQKIIVGKGEYITWKRRIQIQTTRKLLGQETKSKNCRNCNCKQSFFLLEICIHNFLYREFSNPTRKKLPHLKCQFPPKITIEPKSLLYKHSGKWLSPSSSLTPITQRERTMIAVPFFFQKCKTKHENLTNRTNIKEEH